MTVPAMRASASDEWIHVVVLGDIARSPRMCLHALALAEAGFRVEMIGFIETTLPADLAGNERIHIRPISSPRVSSSLTSSYSTARRPTPSGEGASYLLGVGPRLFAQLVGLVRALAGSRPAAVALVQNPPSLHVLPVLLVLRWLRGTKVIVDWHNFGWTLLALRLGERSVVVALAGWLERALAGRADGHLCVSRAMSEWLRSRCSLEATPFLDRPARFRGDGTGRGRTRESALRTLGLTAPVIRELLDGRAVLVVSSTSWSADEDFSLLLDALRLWSEIADAPELPHLVLVVSGRGSGRAEFERAVDGSAWCRLTVRTVWLGVDEYHAMLSAADLGVCLHRSSSGVDLPMKLADMIGAGLPVGALDYGPCLREAFADHGDGLYFRDAAGLVALWRRIFGGDRSQLTELRRRLACDPGPSWQDDWRRLVEPVVRGLLRADC